MSTPTATEPTALVRTDGGEAGIERPSQAIHLASGRRVEVGGEGGEEWITVRAPSGEVLVTMRLGDEGPVFSFARGSLAIEATETLSLACETLEMEATGSASLTVGGDLREQVGGSAVRRSGGAQALVARAVTIAAERGGVTVEATGDVSLDGERIRLNSEDPPMPLTWEEHRARQAQAGTPEPAKGE